MFARTFDNNRIGTQSLTPPLPRLAAVSHLVRPAGIFQWPFIGLRQDLLWLAPKRIPKDDLFYTDFPC
jgi:hypothetical protein